MAQIQPISIWTEKGTKVAEELIVRGAGDDYSTMASNYFELRTASTVGENDQVILGEIIRSGNIPIVGQDYQDWTGSNEWILGWVAGQIGVVLI